MKKTPNTSSGFTLIELSVVLVIIGLIVGGVLVGRDLIRAAELRSVSNDATNYMTAVQAFRLKYNAFPGDMPNAYSIFSTSGSCTNNDVTVDPTGCNGNGDSRVTSGQEAARLWQHLALANMIQGSYTGISATAFDLVAGSNIPKIRFDNAGHHMVWRSMFNKLSHFITVGTTEYWTNGPFLNPTDAMQVDTKFDDGVFDTGRVMVTSGWTGGSWITADSSGCFTAVGAINTPNLTVTAKRCIVMYYAGF